ncbi:MAG: TonB-dependent receptor [Rhizobiales bacterium]|nr:TonB-dependent receptor [Hyphomicrobiales bacterium]
MARSNGKGGQHRGRGMLAATLMASASIGTILIAVDGAAYAQTTQRTFSIPAGPLSQALASFGRQSGLQVTYPAEITAGKRSPGMNGSATPEQALAQILSGSGLSYGFPNSRTVAISGPDARAESATNVEGAIQLDTIQVSGGRAVAPTDKPYVTPGSSSFISRQQIEMTRGTSVGDTFKGVPGLLSGDDNNGPKFDPSIRGLGVDRVPVRVDGASASVTEYRGYSGAATSNYVDPDLIGGITIKKGPDAGPEGAGAIGGLVSMRTINADDIVKPDKDFGIRLRGGLGDNTRSPVPWQIAGVNAGGPSSLWDANSYFSSAAFATKQQGFDLVAAYVHRESGNYFAGANGPQSIVIPPHLDRNRLIPFMRDARTIRLSDYYGPGSEVLNTSQNMDSLLLKGTLKFAENHTLELAHMGYRNSFGQSMPSMTQISAIPNWNKQLENAEIKQNNYTARYHWKSDDNDLIDLRINSFLTDLRNETMMNAQTSSDFGAGVEPFMSSRTRTWGINISNTSRFESQWGEFSLNYGASYNDEDMVPLQSREQTSFLSSNGTRRMVGLFTNGEWTPTHWLKFNAGVRYDSYRTQDRSNPQDLLSPGNGGLTPSLAGFKFHGHGVSPHASITVTPYEGIQLYGLYAEGFRPPNIWEVTNNVIAINPNLKPERAQNWEVGVNVSRDNVLTNGDKARLKVSYFDNTIHDVIVRDYYFRA